MKQLKLFSEKQKLEFGGSLLKKRRKERRPLNFKLPVHLVLKALDPFILLQNKSIVENLVRKYSKKMNVPIYEMGIHADHIHLAALFPDRQTYVRWIRALTSVLVQKLNGLKWKLRPYTRIASWGRGFQILKNYIRKNRNEGELILFGHEFVRRFADQFWRRNT